MFTEDCFPVFHPLLSLLAKSSYHHLSNLTTRVLLLPWPDIVGLLVQSVAVLGPAASAGLQEGDLIVAANEIEIRSIESLYEQLLAAHGKALTLEVLRGSERRSVSLNASEPHDMS